MAEHKEVQRTHKTSLGSTFPVAIVMPSAKGVIGFLLLSEIALVRGGLIVNVSRSHARRVHESGIDSWC